jgi:hypothetical protein
VIVAETAQLTAPTGTGCSKFNPTCWDDKFGEWLGKVGGNVVDEVAQSFAKASIEVLKTLMTWWVQVPSPGISDNPDDPVYFMHAYTGWLVTWVAVLGLLLAAGRMAWQRRGEPFREAVSGLLTMVIAVGCGVAAVNLAVKAGDSYSKWILDAATNGDVKGNLGKIGALYSAGLLPTMSGVILIVSLLAILSAVVQLAMMVVRSAMLVLLAGALPLAAGAAITPEGRQWFKKMVGWLIAFVLYKPVAATIYAVAFRAMMGDSMSQLQGIILIIFAVVALPALMRFTVPMVSAVGGGGAGAMAGAVGAAALGARMVPSLGSGGRGGGTPASTTQDSPDDGPGGAGTAGTAGQGVPGGGPADRSSPGGTGGDESACPRCGQRWSQCRCEPWQGGSSGGSGTSTGGPGGAGGVGSATGGGIGGGTGSAGAGTGGASGAAGGAAAGATGGAAAAATVVNHTYDKAKGAAQDAAQEATGDEGGPRGST